MIQDIIAHEQPNRAKIEKGVLERAFQDDKGIIVHFQYLIRDWTCFDVRAKQFNSLQEYRQWGINKRKS